MTTESMSSNGQPSPTDDLAILRRALSCGDCSVRVAAVKTLERLGDRHSIKLLAEALKDEHYEVREGAYQALRKLGPNSMPELIPALKDENFYARMYAALAITDQIVQKPNGKYDEAVVDALTHALLDKSIYVRRSAYDALKVIEYNKIFKSLVGSLDDPDYGVRMEAVIALGKLSDRRATKSLVRMLATKDTSIRRCTASALGRIKDKKATEHLIGLLYDADGSVRKEAVRALGAIGDERSVACLLGTLKDTEPSVREQAAEALDGFKSFKYAGPLVAALGDRDAAIRKYAARALGRAKGSKAVEALIRALEDGDGSVRDEAQLSLAHIGKGAIGRLRAALNDDSDVVQGGAEKALELMSKAKAKKRMELAHKLRSPEVWMEIEAAISAYTKEKQASLTSFNI